MFFFFFQAEDGIRDLTVTGVQTCALPISPGVGRTGVPARQLRGVSRGDGPRDRLLRLPARYSADQRPPGPDNRSALHYRRLSVSEWPEGGLKRDQSRITIAKPKARSSASSPGRARRFWRRRSSGGVVAGVRRSAARRSRTISMPAARPNFRLKYS